MHRQTVRYALQSVVGYEKFVEITRELLERGQIPPADLDVVENKLRIARLGTRDAEAAYRRTKLDLGSLMNLKIDEIGKLELRGTIEDLVPPPPEVAELRQIALADRPDVISFRLGIAYAQAQFKLAKANAYSDVYVLWQPYTFQDNSPYGLKSQYSWALGLTVPLPIYNRNQGGITRAKINITQSEVQLAEIERQVGIDVEKAAQEYEVSRRWSRNSARTSSPTRGACGTRRSSCGGEGKRACSITCKPSSITTTSSSNTSTPPFATGRACSR